MVPTPSRIRVPARMRLACCVLAATVLANMITPTAASAAQADMSRNARCLATAVYFEARGESPTGQEAVAAVILNRVESPKWPDSVCDVVFQNQHRRNACQFSFACDGVVDTPRERLAWSRAEAIAEKAMRSKADERAVPGATHYHANYVKPRWASAMKRVGTIGSHIFYREI